MKPYEKPNFFYYAVPENMIEEKGQETINKIFTEYFMVTVSKAMKCDRLAKALEDKNCTIEQLKEILYE